MKPFKELLDLVAADALAARAEGIRSPFIDRIESGAVFSPGELVRLGHACAAWEEEVRALSAPGLAEVGSYFGVKLDRFAAALDPVPWAGTQDEAVKIAERVGKLPPIKTADTILATAYPPVRMLLDRVLPDSGVGILAASKASGKTWALLQLAAAVATGGIAFGRLRAERAPVLFLELELSERKIRERLEKMRLSEVPGLDVATKWRTGSEGVQDIEAAVIAHGYRLVVVDVLARLWPAGADMNAYQDAYAFLGPLREMANKLGVFILFATHTRKMEAEDAIDQVMGSVGITGTADVVIGIKRARGSEEACIRVDGNDIESAEFAIRFQVDPMGFEIVDMDPREAGQSGERRAILEVLRGASAPARTADIAAALGKADQAVSKLLAKLKKEGLVVSPQYGQWEIGRQSEQSGQSTHLARAAGKVPEFAHFAEFAYPYKDND